MIDCPDYVTVDEVRRVCQELGLPDWTQEEPHVTIDDARTILEHLNVQGMTIPLDDFRQGLEVELEHGLRFKDANVTNNHPLLTGKIVLAHFKESYDYYRRLAVAELEGDLHKAILSGDIGKVRTYYRRLIDARMALDSAERSKIA